MRFYLGTHRPYWLGWPEFSDVRLFVSHRTLGPRKSLPRAVAPWSLDSGGFTEIKDNGRWLITPTEYVESVARYKEEIGQLEWASPQDWMCEDVMLASTGRTVEEHQMLTIESVCLLRQMAPDLPFIPVLQGREPDDYLRHIRMYEAAGIDLRLEPVVGVGSVCRRQATAEIGALIAELAQEQLALHGFGVKRGGLERYSEHLTSADSMAWSMRARYEARDAQNGPWGKWLCPWGETHANCANCHHYALDWRERLIDGRKGNR